ncbi:heparin lyase I family protein [Pseudomonas sp. CGJS7]|uniref:heparin lyase I family protein n=1 Tax=Pseudomonas sp. CGJS7 TaxID=3109348 RepID=UPI00300ACCC3
MIRFSSGFNRALAASALIAVSTATSAQTQALDIGYETGSHDSGYPGLIATHASAADAASIVSDQPRSGRFAQAHKVTWRNPAYTSAGAPRSESTASDVRGPGNTLPGRYAAGQHRRYTFSVLLKDWEPWLRGRSDAPVDIVWQFKHFSGSPDMFVGVRRNQMILRYGDKQAVLVEDVRPYNNRWIDFRFDVYWARDQSGHFSVDMRLSGQADYVRKVAEPAFATFDPDNPSPAGAIKWGLYRPDAAAVPGAAATRIVYHDDITVTELP